MGFFSGSTTSTVIPQPRLFDGGIFSDNKANDNTRELAEQFLSIISQGNFLKQGGALNDLGAKLERGDSFLSDPERGSILDQHQAQFNKRGLKRITENEARASLAPFENQAKTTAINTFNSLNTARSNDLSMLSNLIAESRPDLLVGSTTTNKNNPSGFAKLGALLQIPGMVNQSFNDAKSLGNQFG